MLTTKAWGCFSLMFISMLACASSSGWFAAWTMLELNLVFILLFMMTNQVAESPSMMKYFIVSAISSLILVTSYIFTIGMMTVFLWVPMSMALLIKLGGFPFHSWMISLASTCAPEVMGAILTVQKLGPMMLMSGFSYNNWLMGLILLGGVMSAIYGFLYKNLYVMITYSSVSHVSWLVLMMFSWPVAALIYLSLYSVIVLNLFAVLSVSVMNAGSSTLILILLWSLAGIPPLMGFSLKILLLNSASCILSPAGLSMIFMASCLLVLLYMSATVSSLLYKNFMATPTPWGLGVLASVFGIWLILM